MNVYVYSVYAHKIMCFMYVLTYIIYYISIIIHNSIREYYMKSYIMWDL